MRKIDLTSSAFLLAEKRETPMHIGGLNLFTLPTGVNERRFLADLKAVLRNVSEFRRPFGEYARTAPWGLYWEEDQHIDLDYHVRHSALPRPGHYRELFALTSRLHSTRLDRTRPLWETHLIEGLRHRQFALYQKMHHATIDGVGAMLLARSAYSSQPGEHFAHSPFSIEAYHRMQKMRAAQRATAAEPRPGELRNVLAALAQSFDSSVHLGSAMSRFAGAFLGRAGNLAVPWHNVPRTSINTRVCSARRFVAQSWEFERVREVATALGATLNDIVLAMCSGALRRYLLSRQELTAHSLKALAPMSTRMAGDVDSANAVAFITVDLATNTVDPERRLRQIQNSMRAGKSLFQDLSPREAAIFTQLTQMPAILSSILGLAARFPAYSTVISNVPGPREKLYWNGAGLDGIYPASVIFDGFAMNITMVSYHRSLDFGIVACRRSLPQIQRIIDHLEEALRELEDLAGLPVPGRSRKRQRTAGSGATVKAGSTGNKPGATKNKAAGAASGAKARRAAPARKSTKPRKTAPARKSTRGRADRANQDG